MKEAPRLAVFVSPHGFGHAARAAALMGSLHGLTGARFELFAATPEWFFDESVEGLYRRHQVDTDVGFRQRSALVQDVEATVAALDAMLPFDEAWVEDLAATVTEAGCRAVLCDIAPLGIAVAERAGVPSVLVESFTWPWLYEPLEGEAPRLAGHGSTLAGWFERADVHVQTDPLCHASPTADMRAPPMCRPVRRARSQVRAVLDVDEASPLVVLTMGGVAEEKPFLRRLRDLEDVTFLVTGAPEARWDGNLRLFPGDARLYMPDLVLASDAVVAKAGYSTVAEVWAAGRPLAFVTREDSREMGPLRDWIRRELKGFEIPGSGFASGGWIERVPELLATKGSEPPSETGALTVARFLVGALGLESA